MRKELELSLARESLELSTNLAVATAKEEVLLDAETNSVVDLFARHGSDESVTRVISQSDGLANVDQMETSGARDGLSVGVDCQLMLLVLPLAVLIHLSELVLVTECQSVRQLMLLVLLPALLIWAIKFVCKTYHLSVCQTRPVMHVM